MSQKYFAYLNSSDDLSTAVSSSHQPDHMDVFKPHSIATYRYRQGHEVKQYNAALLHNIETSVLPSSKGSDSFETCLTLSGSENNNTYTLI